MSKVVTGLKEAVRSARLNPQGFRPMLAAKSPADLSALKFPLYVSPKLDGIRCIVLGGVAYSRNLKPIPNKRIQVLAKTWQHGWDGELISGPPTGNDVWNRSNSCVMSRDSQEPFCFHVFDKVPPEEDQHRTFKERFRNVCSVLAGGGTGRTERYVKHTLVKSVHELDLLEEMYVTEGYEGVMLRSVAGLYKFGRATTKEATLMKLKRFDDAEAVVVGVVEKMHNANEAKKDELGRTKRSTHKANKKPTGMMGALKCWHRDEYGKRTEFEIGTGFDDAQRKTLWECRDDYRKWGAIKYKFQGLTPDGKPRFPVFLGFRDARDM
jgi:DNA ligase-1